MNTKTKEIRTKAGFSVPCPECGAECWPDNVTKLKRQKVSNGTGVTLVLPQHYSDLRCSNCNHELWIALDENGKPLDEIDLGDNEAN
jgi:predicted RNA-binding Zn-ribbon protein involved in translation (DUF1610 family)